MAFFIGGHLTSSDKVVLDPYWGYYDYHMKFFGVNFANYNTNKGSTTTTISDTWYQGTRLYTAKDYVFEPSTNYYSGIDSFIEDNAGPFMIRECCTRYNSSTGKQEVVSYEGDPTWDTDKVNTEYNRMIEFPLFYYYRPSEYSFIVTSHNVNGFLPSAMHFKGGKLYQKAYISKYVLDSEFKSRYGSTNASNTMTVFRKQLRNQGMYILDFPSYSMLCILMLIKYARLDFHINDLPGSPTNLSDIHGLSHYIRSKDGIFKQSNLAVSSTLGLENLYGHPASNITFDGTVFYSDKVYINEDLENITSSIASGTATSSTLLSDLTIMNTTKASGTGAVLTWTYDRVFPYVLLPQTVHSSNTAYCIIPSYYTNANSKFYYLSLSTTSSTGNISSRANFNANGGYKMYRSPLAFTYKNSTDSIYVRSICFI